MKAAAAVSAGGDGRGGGGAETTTTGASSSCSSSAAATALIRNNVAAVSLREQKPRCALLCCSLSLSSSLQEQQPSSSSPSSSSSTLPAAIRAAATFNAALASLAIGDDQGKERIDQTAEELEALARSLDVSDEEEEQGHEEEIGEGDRHEQSPPGVARPAFLSRRVRARVWLRAAEALARVAAAPAAAAEKGGEEEAESEKLWRRVSAAAGKAARLSCSSPSSSAASDAADDDKPQNDPRCQAAALALVAASEVRLGRFTQAREAIREAFALRCAERERESSDGKKDPLLPGARAVLESYLRAMPNAG